MGFPIHTIEMPDGFGPQKSDQLILAIGVLAVPNAGAAVTALGSITAGTGFDELPVITPSGGTLTAGVSPAVPAVVRATSIKLVSATVVAPGVGVAINDTFTINGGALALSGPSGNALAAAGALGKVTATNIQVVSAVVNNGGSGGTPGAVTITGTTGTGTKWQGTGVISAGGVLTGPIAITVPGNYTATPTLAGDTITGGSLTGATVTLQMGALTLSVATAGGYISAPPSGASTTNVVGSSSGLTVTGVFGLGTAVIDESGNYSAAPSWTVTPVDGNGTGASIATGTLGGAGAAVVKKIRIAVPNPSNAIVVATGNTALDAVCEIQSAVGGPETNGNNPNSAAPYISIAVQPRLAANTLTAGQVNFMLAA